MAGAEQLTEPHEIEKLLRCDDANVAEVKAVLLKYHTESLNAVDECHKLFEKVGALFGKSSGFDDYQEPLEAWFRKRCGTIEQNTAYLEQATLIGEVSGPDPTATAKQALIAQNSVIARVYLLLRLGRDFLFGLTDLFRLRTTSMHGYLRIQTESAAILALCGTEQPLAVDWLKPDGKQFYEKHHSTVVTKIRELGLYKYYEEGSNLSLHSRPLGVIGGMLVGQKKAAPGEQRLTYQETDDALEIFLWFCSYLSAHRQILATLPGSLPEVDFSKIDMNRYGAFVDALWAKLTPLWERRKRERRP